MQHKIFITGASSGLGKATAILFANKNWKVYATMRNPGKETVLTKFENIELMELDVTDLQGIEQVAKKIKAEGGVDVVFNNAGYGLAGPLEGTTDEQIVNEINTNLLGVIRVTKAFISQFREKKSGLFINTTSIGGLVAFPLNSVYHATKWALEGWSESMAFELNQLGIGIKTVSPGGISTDFAGRSLETSEHEAYTEMSAHVTKIFMDPERRKNHSTPEEIAAVVYEAATDGKNKLRYVAGEDAKGLYAQRLAVGEEAFRDGIKQRFFNN